MRVLTAFHFLVLTLVAIFCIVEQVESKSKRSVVGIPYWSDWSQWSSSCSVTCGTGQRMRKRTCIIPVEYQMKMDELGAKEKPECPGITFGFSSCNTKRQCPTDGGWTSWGPWNCPVSCGGGIGTRFRECTEPKQNSSGKYCEGSSGEIGPCNMHPCPTKITSQNYQKRHGESALLSCGRHTVDDIYKKFPHTTIYWTKNNETLKIDNVRLNTAAHHILVINSLTFKDNGVYICYANLNKRMRAPLAAVALTVWEPQPYLISHEGENFNLTCHGKNLLVVFQNLTQKWFFDDLPYSGTMKTSCDHDVYTIKSASKNMTGRWSCHVFDDATGKTWTTNTVHLKVLPSIENPVRVLPDRKTGIITVTSTVKNHVRILQDYTIYETNRNVITASSVVSIALLTMLAYLLYAIAKAHRQKIKFKKSGKKIVKSADGAKSKLLANENLTSE